MFSQMWRYVVLYLLSGCEHTYSCSRVSRQVFSGELEQLKQEVAKLKEVALKDEPVAQVCAYTSVTWAVRAMVHYSKLTLPSGSSPLLDITTGLFTAKVRGNYLVTYSGYADNDTGEKTVRMYIKVDNRVHYSKLT